MAHVLIRQKLARYQDFEAVFQADAKRRGRLGSQGGTVFRDTQDPRSIFILLEWDDMERARAFAGGYELREAMEWATSGPGEAWVWVIENSLQAEA
jgi:heme-degrading monooxygenase HmoA